MDKQFDELSKSLAEGVSRREALRKFGVGMTMLLVVCSMTISLSARAEDLYVNASAAANGSGTAASPYWRITDAMVRARADRQNSVIPLSETITVHVGPGTYIGQFGTSSPNGHEELLPIVLNVPNLILQGSTVLSLDSDGLPTGVANKAPQTIIQAKDDVKDYQAALVTITRTTDGDSGDNVTVSGLTLPASKDYSALMVYRVFGFTIAGNYVQRGFQGMWIKMASGTIVGNFMTDASRATIGVDGGTSLFPALVTITANRLTKDHGEGIIEVEPSVEDGAANLGSNSLTAVPLLDGIHADFSTGLGIAITGNDISASLSTGVRLSLVPFAPSVLTAQTGNVLSATVTGNTLNNNGWYGVVVDGGFPSTDPTLSGTIFVTLQGNTLAGNVLGPALFTFGAQGDTILGYHSDGFVANCQFLISDLDSELTSFDFDNPINNPIGGASLNNVLSLNGSANILGVKLTPYP